MYEKTDKRRLYWLIDQYLSNKINESTFCNKFHDSFVNNLYYVDGITPYKGFTDIEVETFRCLLDVVQHFSEYEEDFKLWTGFVTKEQLKQKIIETKEKLKEQNLI